MATRKPTTKIGDIDLTEFRRQKELLTQAANAEVADRISKIEVLLKEIQDIAEASGVQISLYDLKSRFDSFGYAIDDAWNSSSYQC
jgi:hypothetical protein